ncbi:MAG: YdcF family protein [Bacteroidia bacterium]
MKSSLSTTALLSCAFFFLCSHSKNKKEPLDLNCEAENPYDVIIVPGVPYQVTSMETVLKARIFWAKYLYERGITRNIIFSGSSVYTPFVEGKIMKMYADSLGIPADHTFSEEEAEHSTENVFYSVRMAREMGYKRIALATDHYQAFLLRKFMKNRFPDVTILTIVYKHINIRAEWPKIADTTAFSDYFVSLPKREGQLKRLKGTMGMNILYNEKDSSTIWRRVPFVSN